MKFKLLFILLIPIFGFSQNQKKIDSLESKLKTCRLDSNKLKLYGSIIDEWNKTDSRAALNACKRAEILALKINNNKILAQFYSIISKTYSYLEKKDSSLFYAEKSIEICKKHHYKNIEADNYTNIAHFYNITNDNQQAIIFQQKSLDIHTQLKDDIGVAYDLSNLSGMYLSLQNFDKAISYNLKALPLFEKNNLKERLWTSYIQLHVIYKSTRQFKKSLEACKNAIRISKETGIQQDIIDSYKEMGDLFLLIPKSELANFGLTEKEAKNLVFKNLFIAKSMASSFGVESTYSTILNYIGLAHREYKNYDSALFYYTQCLSIDNKLEDYYGVCSDKVAMTEILLVKNKINEALKMGIESLQMAQENNWIEFQTETHELLYNIYKQKGDFKLSLLHYENFITLKDSMYNDEKRLSILNEQASYEYNKKAFSDSLTYATKQIVANAKLSSEKNQKLAYGALALLALAGVGFTFYQYKQKRKTNLQLTEINDKINKQNNTLKTLNTELIVSEENLNKSNNSKEQLINMMSHDLLNPITAITNYNQQIISRKNNTEQLLEAFKTVDAAIQPMHSLLDNMLQWTAIQKEGIKANLKTQDINDIIKEIIGIYRPQAQLKSIKINDHLQDNFSMPMDKSIMSLILRNLINNAIKYSANETTITVSSNADKNMIIIQDEGYGMTDEMITALNKGELHKIESKGTGLGLKLCYEFTEAIGANLHFNNNEGNGVKVEIKL